MARLDNEPYGLGGSIPTGASFNLFVNIPLKTKKDSPADDQLKSINFISLPITLLHLL